MARRIASGALGKPVTEPLSLIGAFDRDYGFANKRLPVWRAAADDGSLRYFETRSGVVAAKVGEVVSVHVIPRPHDDLTGMLPKQKETREKVAAK